MKPTDLREGSFHGVRFRGRGIGGASGQRWQVNEYPGRDDVTADALGNAPNTYQIEAVFTGESWLADYSALLAACMSAKPGEFRHPEGWRILAVPTEPPSYTVVAVGEAVVNLTLTEVGEAPALTSTPDPVSSVGSAVEELLGAVADAFDDAWSAADEVASVVEDAADKATEATESVTALVERLGPSDQVGDTLAALHELDATITALIRSPANLRAKWDAVFASLTDFETLRALADLFGGSAATSAAAKDDTADSGTDAEQQAALNAYAIDCYLWASALGGLANAAAATEYAAYDDALAAVNAASDDMIEAEPLMFPSALAGLIDVRGSLVQSVLVVAQTLPRLETFAPSTTSSTAEIAQLLYRDGRRAGEIEDRNRIQHPGFVAAGAQLLVLTE